MDVVLSMCDEYFFTPYVYPASWSEDDPWRQFMTLNIITDIGGVILYFVATIFSFYVIYDRMLLKHPLMLENQIRKEIGVTMSSIPGLGFLTSLCFLFEVRGYSRLYDTVDQGRYGWLSIAGSVVCFILFTDFLIYWIHRWLHHRFVYKYMHKVHHRWKVPTPFASHAFHPIDGFLQSVPYHLYIVLFPMHKWTYILLYISVNFWTVSIHDGDFRVPPIFQPFINSSAHHTDHHLFYNFNYGQYFTLWDRMGGSYREPSSYLTGGPKAEVRINIALGNSKDHSNNPSNGDATNKKDR